MVDTKKTTKQAVEKKLTTETTMAKTEPWTFKGMLSSFGSGLYKLGELVFSLPYTIVSGAVKGITGVFNSKNLSKIFTNIGIAAFNKEVLDTTTAVPFDFNAPAKKKEEKKPTTTTRPHYHGNTAPVILHQHIYGGDNKSVNGVPLTGSRTLTGKPKTTNKVITEKK